MEILTNALPASALTSKNIVEDGAIPDVPANADYTSAVYLFYRAGILTGNHSLGTFAPQTSISRVEIAAVVPRMADPVLRKRFQLTSSSAIFQTLSEKNVLFCFSSGAPRKISAYEYSIQLTSLHTSAVPGTTKILDGVRYIFSTPYGIANGKEFRIYCPGIQTSSLPVAYID